MIHQLIWGERWSRNRYLQFYDAKEIMDIDVRPDLGIGKDWES